MESCEAALPKAIESLLATKSPFSDPSFQSAEESKRDFLSSKILVIGAGGLGCELLKSLALSGFRQIDVIDLDTIDVSNLNRQFLFRLADVGKPKAVCAAEFIKKRVPGITINPHFCKIQELPDEFYSQFSVVIGGLDSIDARNWISDKLVELSQSCGICIPYIDGGTEAWSGHVKVIFPGETACMRCQASLFPPPVQYQLCTIATSPRQPEHCIAWAKDLKWPADRPNEAIDGDNDDHIKWIMEKAIEHGNEYGIHGIDFATTRGVVKNIIPAIASTQAIIAAACTTEAIKLVTRCAAPLNNNLLILSKTGVNSLHFEFQKVDDCPVCGRKIIEVPEVEGETVQQLRDRLGRDFGMPNPSLSTDEVKIFLPIIKSTAENLGEPVKKFVSGPDVVIVATSRTVDQPMEFVIVPKK